MTTMIPQLSPTDDDFHPPTGNDPYWTETAWYAFDVPERSLSGSIYPLFRPNLGICSLAVHVWDDTGSTPWDALYSRLLWHLPMPAGDLRSLEFEGLRYTTLEPLRRYHVEYRDGERLTLDLEYTGHRAPSVSTTQVPTEVTGISHFDQACDVRGRITLEGESFDIAGFGHRDRSWYDRPDNRARRSASVSFGDQSADEQFILFRALNLSSDQAADAPLGGYLIRGGVSSPLVTATRRVVERVDGRPRRFVVSLRDAEGRTLEAEGRARNNFAFQCSPPVFAWFTQVEWSSDHGSFVGEDQESHSSGDTRRDFQGGAA
jgi:hypothetical protein